MSPRLFPLSDAEIAQVVAELGPRLEGATVGKAYDRDDDSLAIEIGAARLLLSTHPRASRLHLEARREKGKASPSAFAMLIRKHLSGHRLDSLSVLADGERAVVLSVGPGRERLVAELTGPHANLFLVHPGGRILGMLKRTGDTVRGLAVGQPYEPPHVAPATARFRGKKRFGEAPGVAERVANHYDAALREKALADLRVRAEAALRKSLHRLQRRESALSDDLARADAAGTFKKYGDLLLAHIHALPGRGREWAEVADYYDEGRTVAVPLDPRLDTQKNAQRYYHQHKRLSAARRRIEARLAATRKERAEITALLAAIPTLSAEHLGKLAPAPRGPVRRKPPGERRPYREYRSAGGHRIWVGRSAKDNDRLTFGVAHGNDLWLHTRDVPGPHVVVPLRRREEIVEQTLLDAATLAAHFSPLGKDAQVDVSYTRVKNLRKPKGAPPGLVYVSGARTLRVRLEPRRIERLLASLEDD